MNDSVTLYGHKLSGLTKAVRMALFEKGVAYRLCLLDSADIAAGALNGINPYRMTPTLVDGEASIFETVAILHYVARRFAGLPLLPTDTLGVSTALQWTIVASQAIYEDTVTGLVTARLLPTTKGESVDEEKVAALAERVVSHLDILDEALATGGYVAGADLSIADLMVTPILHYLAQTPEGERLIPHRYHLARWYEGMISRPSASACL